MTAIEVARKVASEHQAVLFRPKLGESSQYDVKDVHTGRKGGWTILDGFTASAIVQVYNALNDQNKLTFAALSIERMARVAFQIANKS